MTLKPISAGFTIKWSAHDSWSELYVGIRRLAYTILPTDIASQTAEDSALCQLALIGASSLMEIALFQLLKPFAASGTRGLTVKKLESAGYAEMLEYLEKVTGKALDRAEQPIKSAESLRKRRNLTIHKTSEVATVPMARAALYSAVEGCRSIYLHAGVMFPYASLLVEDSIPVEPWFSDVHCPPAA